MYRLSDRSTLQYVLFSNYSASLAPSSSKHIGYKRNVLVHGAGEECGKNKSQGASVPAFPVTSRDEDADFSGCMSMQDYGSVKGFSLSLSLSTWPFNYWFLSHSPHLSTSSPLPYSRSLSFHLSPSQHRNTHPSLSLSSLPPLFLPDLSPY